MGKLKLELDELHVESFDVQRQDEVRGTVAGQNEPAYTESCGGSCVNTCVSCVNTCYNTCQASCWNTCQTCNTCEHHCSAFPLC
ncbi:MAG TPA: hypothetical protein VEX86_24480 [Longimicrobium sp.]|nr:hypothetical protein [Longimicrobium sp.]